VKTLEILQVKCRKCSYEWEYKGRSRYYVTCPQCRKHFNIRYLTLRIEERERAKQLAEEKRIQKIARLEELTKTFDFSKIEKESFQNTYDDLEKIPKTSGLYYFYDGDERLLYIGKAGAGRLRNRVGEHRSHNDFLRKIEYYQRIKMSKNYEPNKNFERNLYQSLRYLGRTMPYPLAIDQVFHRTKRIEIEEIPVELIKSREKEMILKLKPLFNRETACDEYYSIQFPQ